MIYKGTGVDDKPAEQNVIWNDPDVGIKWPVPARAVIRSDQDKALPRLRGLPALLHAERRAGSPIDGASRHGIPSLGTKVHRRDMRNRVPVDGLLRPRGLARQ